jgi:hypothetical protein
MGREKAKKRNKRPIISGYLEKVGAKIFDSYSGVITDMIKGHQGVYALYKTDKLYYVGLASKLKNRIKHHLKDRHQGKWTRFSLYIIRQEEHIKEIESLVLRIAYPVGNAVKGKLKSSENLLKELKRRIKGEQNRQFNEIIGMQFETETKKRDVNRQRKTDRNNPRPLKDLFPGGKVIYVNYKDKKYKAWVYRNGRIKLNGIFYDSPSSAGLAVTRKQALDGWRFWKYKNPKGNLVCLDELRK